MVVFSEAWKGNPGEVEDATVLAGTKTVVESSCQVGLFATGWVCDDTDGRVGASRGRHGLSFRRFLGTPLQPLREALYSHNILEAAHLEQIGCSPSHLRCLDLHSIQASGDGRTIDGGVCVIVMSGVIIESSGIGRDE